MCEFIRQNVDKDILPLCVSFDHHTKITSDELTSWKVDFPLAVELSVASRMCLDSFECNNLPEIQCYLRDMLPLLDKRFISSILRDFIIQLFEVSNKDKKEQDKKQKVLLIVDGCDSLERSSKPWPDKFQKGVRRIEDVMHPGNIIRGFMTASLPLVYHDLFPFICHVL